ncbi:DoxX-like family protein [Aliikangiella coralliicola]|uniref:NAD-dependent dehydratase n=1 Tax=Aliikangiella coralliicola TaxID=2592383 RepID=A0A545U7H5_9GAMM|nr:DoxX-like family protein [Aliikangiella coralliicola]TQV85418.1 NAD-dependent dehydratase [Aliikangiella coralliicola]
MSYSHLTLIRLSLASLWIFTALTSLVWGYQTGVDILISAKFHNIRIDESTARLLVYAGSGVDFIIGVWLLSNRSIKLCCNIQIFVIIIFTLLITIIDASYWFHPFGPITKNIPILVLILIYRAQLKTNSS